MTPVQPILPRAMTGYNTLPHQHRSFPPYFCVISAAAAANPRAAISGALRFATYQRCR